MRTRKSVINFLENFSNNCLFGDAGEYVSSNLRINCLNSESIFWYRNHNYRRYVDYWSHRFSVLVDCECNWMWILWTIISRRCRCNRLKIDLRIRKRQWYVMRMKWLFSWIMIWIWCGRQTVDSDMQSHRVCCHLVVIQCMIYFNLEGDLKFWDFSSVVDISHVDKYWEFKSICMREHLSYIFSSNHSH